ncbi:hypothetical protein CMUS01_01312 [Colletotrichum musicola]|uniref:Uncharacterized protein n=1 Tax=Colletotrichum musicola TaxID=2175873 RepID=A0A8H6NX53_9PEZI|nr:hypothetical protein CMUS01_01312 [Colletotrichum musicola]
MVNPNRWSWSGAPRGNHVREDVVTGIQPSITPSHNPDSDGGSVPADKKLQPAAAGGVSRRLSKNRWSWRPDTAISVTLEDQRENEQAETPRDQSRAERPATANRPRRLTKNVKKVDSAAPSSRPRPLSMIAPASSSFGDSPTYSHVKSTHQDGGESLPSPQPDPLPTQSAATGVKEVFTRFVSRQLSRRQPKISRSAQQGEPEPTPPPQTQEQQQASRPMQDPPMRRGPQLHNPRNTLRGAESPVSAQPVTQAQVQGGRIDNGRIAAPLPGLDEQSELQLPAPPGDTRPATVTDAEADAATGLGLGTTPSSSAAAPSAEETGLLGRLMRRRLAPKDKEGGNNKTRWISTGADNTSQTQPAGADGQHQDTTAPDTTTHIDSDETPAHEMQKQSLPAAASHPSPKMKDKTTSKTKTENDQIVSDVRSPSSSTVPRFLRQVVKPHQTNANSNQNQSPGAVTPHKPGSQSQSQASAQPQPNMSSSVTASQPKLRSKPSFGKRFWLRSGANNFGEDEDDTGAIAKAETSVPAAPVHRPVYVPKHAASDFSRTTYPPRHHRHSYSLDSNRDNGVRQLATIDADGAEDESQPRPQQKHRTASAEKAERRRSREISSSKHEGPSAHELHRRLEIVKSSEIEVVTTRETSNVDPWPQQHRLLHSNSNASSSNAKAPAPGTQSRPRSSQRHSFNLVADPFARDLTPPKSASPVEMEAPFDPPSHPQKMAPEQAHQQAPRKEHQDRKKPSRSRSEKRSNGRPKTQPEELPREEMTDFERFIADAEAAEREYHAQMWRNLARRSGHYGYSDNVYSSYRPDPVTPNAVAASAAAYRGNKRDSAYYSVNKRASMMSTAAEDERNLIHGQPVGQRALKHQTSISKRIAEYIKPPKSAPEPAYDDWLGTSGRANRRSFITGVAE